MSRLWKRYKPAEYYSASDFEKFQWACGIPSKFWNASKSSIHFASAKFEHKGAINQIPKQTQRKYYEERFNNPEMLLENRFSCFTSFPTDDHAMAAACVLANKLASYIWTSDDLSDAKGILIRVIDIQEYEKCMKYDKEFYSTAPDMLILYNLNDNTSRERLSMVVDLLRQFEGKYRAVIAASESPLEFARKRLYYEPQEVYHFEGDARRVMTR